MEGTQAVIHLAALLHVVDPPRGMKNGYKRTNVMGTAVVVAAARQAGIKRVVFFSTIAVYGRSKNGILSEDSATRPDTYYGQTKLEGERLVLEAEGASGRPMGTVLRLGAVYGSRVKGNYRRLVQALARGWFIPVGAGSNRRTIIYGKDVGRAAVLAARHPNAAGRVYNVTDGTCHTMLEITGAICAALGRRPPRWRLPARPVRWFAGLAEDGARLVRISPLVGRATIDTFVDDFAVSGDRIQSELGFSPEFGLARGWEETIREMRRTGVL
jgi:nucleoside-diphosphate-sugar epimerase